MKKLVLAFAFLSLTALAQASDTATDIVSSSVVQSTLALLQSKHDGKCTTPKAAEVNLMCGGARPRVDRLKLQPSGCAFALQILCPKEAALFLGTTLSVSLIDASGTRADVEPYDAGFSFREISIDSVE